LQEIGDAVLALQSDKQDVLVSGTNIKTINGNSLLGSGNISISGSGGTWGTITGTLSAQTDLQTVLDGKADTSALGSAAFTNSSSYATSAQGTLADSALQPSSIGNTVQGYDANTAKTNLTQSFTAPQRGAFTTVTAVSGTHTLNMGAGQNFVLTAVTGVNTITASNVPANSQYGSFEIVHLGSATQSLAWNSIFRFTGATPSLPSVAGRFLYYYAVNSAGTIAVTPWGNIT
jgi:hypothetical protein